MSWNTKQRHFPVMSAAAHFQSIPHDPPETAINFDYFVINHVILLTKELTSKVQQFL